LSTAEITFVPGTVLLSVPVATPSGPVTSEGWISVFPLPVPWSVTVAPSIGSPSSSLTVTMMLEEPVTASTDGGAAVMVDTLALGFGCSTGCSPPGTSSSSPPHAKLAMAYNGVLTRRKKATVRSSSI
jgi:hypothetical protein